MEKDKEKTRVIFRVFRGKLGGDVIALFPHMPGTNHAGTCGSYQHIGQHGSADPWHVMGMSRPATPEEYAPLKRELEGFGYNLDIRKRTTRHDYGGRLRAMA